MRRWSKTWTIVVVALLFPTAAQAQLTAERIASDRVRGFIDALATRQQSVLADWVEENLVRRETSGTPEVFAERMLRMYLDWGAFELHSIEPIRRDGKLVSVHALGRTPRDGGWRELQFSVEGAPEYRLDRIFVNLTAPPIEIPNGTLDDPEVWRGLERYLHDIAESQGFNGGMLVARGDSILAEAYAGWADIPRRIPNDADTRFNIGSGGKMFTAVTLLRLAERGQVDLDVPIATYLPNYRDEEFARTATLRHLLTHRSGLGDYWDEEYEAAWDTITDHRALLAHIDPPERKPGEHFQYSNSGYALAGRIAEVATGRDFYDLVADEVFAPAGMATDAYPIRNRAGPAFARAYERDDSEARQGARGSAAGGAQVTLRGMLAFSRALFGGELVSQASLKTMTEPRWTTQVGARYGLGLFVDINHEGMVEIGHGGAAPGAHFRFTYLPAVDLTVVLAINRTGGGMETILDAIRTVAAR